MISVIIPTYNEGKSLELCIASLKMQSYKDIEIIVVDDGSNVEPQISFKVSNIRCFKQNHKGPATARNLGASHARGDILVFADADMTFDRDYIKHLIEPITRGDTIGTFTKDEYVSNWQNGWARCWNYFQGISSKRRIPLDYPVEAPVFRAILKKEFDKVSGFDDIGFTDDWTLSRKLGVKSTVAPGAVCYHHNPDNLREIYKQARWIGKNEFITGSFLKRVVSLIKYSPLIQIIVLVINLIKYKDIRLILFTIVYSFAISISVLFSFVGENKSK